VGGEHPAAMEAFPKLTLINVSHLKHSTPVFAGRDDPIALIRLSAWRTALIEFTKLCSTPLLSTSGLTRFASSPMSAEVLPI